MTFGFIGVIAVFAIAAIGSALGMGSAGMAAIGAWKKNLLQNKPAPFLLVIFVGAPLTQTIYGYLLLNAMLAAQGPDKDWLFLAIGVLGGIAMAFSAWLQGKSGAAASDAFAETGKGFGNYILVLGLIETVALFAMVFLLGVINA